MKTTKTQNITLDSLIKPFMGLELSDTNMNPHAWTPAKAIIEGLIKDCDYRVQRTQLTIAEKASDIRHERDKNRSDAETDFRIGNLIDQYEKLVLQLEEYHHYRDVLTTYYKSVFGVEFVVRTSLAKKQSSKKAMTANFARADEIIAKYSNMEVVA